MKIPHLVRAPLSSLLLPPLLSAVLVISSYSPPGVSADGQTYLQIARNIHYGIGLGWQALWATPFHSILIALVAWLPGLGDLQMAAGIVAAIMGVGLTAAVCFLACQVFDRETALIAGFITAVFPHFRSLSRSTEPEITYTALLVLSLALLLLALRRRSFITAAGAGGCFSLAYMTRSEGFIIMLLVLCAALATSRFSGSLKGAARLTATIILFFFITSLPYLLFLKRNYGTWVISPKATYVLIWMKSRIYHDNDNGEIDNEELWGLDPGTGRLKWQRPSGVRELGAFLMSHPAKSLNVYLHNLSWELPGKIPNNSGMQHYPQVYPVLLTLLALFAAFRPWGESSALKKGILLSPFLILLILPVYTEGWWKYLVPYAPLLIIAATAGLLKIAALFSGRSPGMATLVFRLSAAGLILWYWYAAFPPRQTVPVSSLDQGRRNYAEEASQAGRWIAATLGPGKNYMVRWNKLVYPLNGLWTAEPVADLDGKLWYARTQGADYYVVELPPDVPENALASPWPGLALEVLYKSPQSGYRVAVFRILRNGTGVIR